MGRYATWSADFLPRYPLKADAFASSAIAEAACIQPAEADLDSRLGGRFTVPFSSNNQTAKDLTIDLAYLFLVEPDDEGKTRTMRARVDKAIEELNAGRRIMVTTSGEALQASTGGVAWSSTQGDRPIFDVDAPANWAVSSETIANIETSRA